MRFSESKSSSTSKGKSGSPIRRWLDANGARAWLWAAVGLAMAWLLTVVHIPV